MLQPTPETLASRLEIGELKARYCRFLDTKQWPRLRLLFADDARFDGFGSAPSGSDADTFVTGLSGRLTTAVSVHHCHTPEIAFVTDERARGIWQMMDYVQFPPDARPREAPDSAGFMGFGYYEEDYVRRDGHWQFSYMRLVRLRIDPLPIDHPPPRAGFLNPSPDWL